MTDISNEDFLGGLFSLLAEAQEPWTMKKDFLVMVCLYQRVLHSMGDDDPAINRMSNIAKRAPRHPNDRGVSSTSRP